MRKRILIKKVLCVALSALVVATALPSTGLDVLAAQPEEATEDASSGDAPGEETGEETQTGNPDEENGEEVTSEESNVIDATSEYWEVGMITGRIVNGCIWKFYDDGTLVIRDYTQGITEQSSDWGFGNYKNQFKKVDMDITEGYNLQDMFYYASSLEEAVIKVKHASGSAYGMFRGCSQLTSLDVSAFDTSDIANMSYMFYDCSKIKTLDLSSFDTSKVTNMSYMFRNCNALETILFDNWDTAKVTNMAYMFQNCYALKNMDVSEWNTQSVTYMQTMFAQCQSLEAIDFTNWDVSNVTYMYEMFYGCKSLKRLDLSGFVTTKLQEAYSLFYGCSSLTEVKLDQFDTSNISNFGSFFSNCSSLTGIDLSMFDTANAKYFNDMFYNCSGLKTLDLSGFNTEKGYTMYRMFYGCSSLETLDLSSFNTANVNQMHYMFAECTSLKSVDLSSFDTSYAYYVYAMFYNCTNLESLDLSNFDFTKAGSYSDFLTGCVSLKELKTITNLPNSTTIALPYEMQDTDGNPYTALPKQSAESITLTLNETVASGYVDGYKWELTSDGVLTIRDDDGNNTSGTTTSFAEYKQRVTAIDMDVTSAKKLDSLFSNYSYLEIATIKTKNCDVTSMQSMFSNCGRLKRVDLSGMNTTGVSSMAYMFNNCYALEEVNLSGVDTSKVANFSGMFYQCQKLKQLDLSGFNTSNAANMYCMFAGCSSLESINLTSFDTKNVADMSYMFSECSKLETLDVTTFNTSKVTNMYRMFADCHNLKSLDVTSFDTARCSNFHYMFYACAKLESLDLSNFIINYSRVSGFLSGCNSLQKIKAVTNLTFAITLPYEMYDADNVPYTELPLELPEEVWLVKNGVSIPVEVTFESKNYSLVPGKETQLKLVNLPGDVLATNFVFTSMNPEVAAVDATGKVTALAIGSTRIVATYENYRCICLVEVKNSDFEVKEIEAVTYTGAQITPQVKVYDNGVLLKEGTDYTLKYANNTVVADKTAKKAPSVTITGIKNYTGKVTKTFSIIPYDATGANISAKLSQDSFVVKNTVQKPVPVITFNGKKLSANKDYTFSYPDTSEGAYQKEGEYEVKVDFINNFTGSLTLKYTIKDGILISKAKIQKIPDMKYTGSAIKPVPEIIYNKTTLVEGTDFTCEYFNNRALGTATIKITGKGEYFGTTQVTFKIVGTDISKASVTGLTDCVYTGSAITQNVKVSLDNGTTFLELGKDYIVSYENNVNAGTAKIKITGVGSYQGTITKTFKITPYDLEKNEGNRVTNFPTSDISVSYEKSGAKPAVSLKFNGKAMNLSTDCTITYANNKAVAASTDKKAPTITIKGKGNFKGTVSVPFTITQTNLSTLTMTAEDVVYVNKAGKFVSTPVITDKAGQKLKAGTDYDKNVTYTCNGFVLNPQTYILPAGSQITVTVTGIGNYTGELSTTYRIATAPIKSAKITVKSKTYTGSAITLSPSDIKVTIGKQTLKYGTDYQIIGYSNNIATGNANVTIKGIGNYAGTKTVKFKIVPKNFLDFLFSILS